jgi:hypothetical protein
MATMMVSCGIPNKKTEIGDKDKPKTETTSPTITTTTPQTTSSTQTTKTVEITNPPIITVSAVTLYSDYHANEVRADNKYKDKILKVSGTIKQIRKTFLDDIIVEISGAEWGSIDCKIVTEQTDEASNLNKGQQVTIVGKCTGMLIGDVQLKNCTIK